MKIVLASSSLERQNIFNMLGIKYRVITSMEPEKSNQTKPSKYVKEISLIKAKSVEKQVDEKAIIVSADTIIYANNKIYEKPKNKEEAYNNLKELSNVKSIAYTGITIIDMYQNKKICTSSKVSVYFNKMDEEEIKWYVNNETKILNCCGYVPTGKASLFINKIVGD